MPLDSTSEATYVWHCLLLKIFIKYDFWLIDIWSLWACWRFERVATILLGRYPEIGVAKRPLKAKGAWIKIISFNTGKLVRNNSRNLYWREGKTSTMTKWFYGLQRKFLGLQQALYLSIKPSLIQAHKVYPYSIPTSSPLPFSFSARQLTIPGVSLAPGFQPSI